MPSGRSLKLEPERFFDGDDERVLVFMRGTAEGEGSGFRSRAGPHMRSRSGTGSSFRLKVYADRDEALEAAGLRQ